MENIKPVAYYKDYYNVNGKERVTFNNDPSELGNDFKNDSMLVPLYTKEQLQVKPRVKMTQAEFEEFKKLSESGVDTIYDAFDLVNSDRGETDEFENIYDRLFGGDDFIRIQKNQLEFSNLWVYYNPEEPEGMIDIIPDKKWFVRSKKHDNGLYYVLEQVNYYYPTYKSVLNDIEVSKFGYEFDTKVEAEEWTNPLTEAVLLPVRG